MNFNSTVRNMQFIKYGIYLLVYFEVYLLFKNSIKIDTCARKSTVFLSHHIVASVGSCATYFI